MAVNKILLLAVLNISKVLLSPLPSRRALQNALLAKSKNVNERFLVLIKQQGAI